MPLLAMRRDKGDLPTALSLGPTCCVAGGGSSNWITSRKRKAERELLNNVIVDLNSVSVCFPFLPLTWKVEMHEGSLELRREKAAVMDDVVKQHFLANNYLQYVTSCFESLLAFQDWPHRLLRLD